MRSSLTQRRNVVTSFTYLEIPWIRLFGMVRRRRSGLSVGAPGTRTVWDYGTCVLPGCRCILMMWAGMFCSGDLGKDGHSVIQYGQVCTLS